MNIFDTEELKRYSKYSREEMISYLRTIPALTYMEDFIMEGLDDGTLLYYVMFYSDIYGVDGFLTHIRKLKLDKL